MTQYTPISTSAAKFKNISMISRSVRDRYVGLSGYEINIVLEVGGFFYFTPQTETYVWQILLSGQGNF